MVQLAQEVIEEKFPGRIQVEVISFGSPKEKGLRRLFSLEVKGFVLAEEESGKILRFKHLKDIWKHFRDPEKEKEYLEREFRKFLSKT
ncbi:hypothetical protein DBT_1292 [Dissulfuribacter thermophilus]|uniref:Uncharacterized protein n=1 Tax=Dissulfuribacter thermophilus TaxID=1156395 RepID=A0A1B9F5I3_9BACT|nr:hypothetical protein DBT_1292 [Dissulfuribacter thermophilus]